MASLLVVATNAAFEPFEYTKGENYYGIDMEIAKALADKLGKELVIQNMDFDAVCLSVGQQKCDIAMAGLTIKPDREEYVAFSDSYYKASQKLIVPSDNTEFDECKTADDVNAILNAKDSSSKIGFQTGTTGQFYCSSGFIKRKFKLCYHRFCSCCCHYKIIKCYAVKICYKNHAFLA